MAATRKKRTRNGRDTKSGKFGPGNPGRPKGAKSKRTTALREWLDEKGARPEQFLAYFMLGEHEKIGMRKSDLTPTLRVQAARDLMPYCWPKLSAVEAELKGGSQPLRVVIEGFGD